MNLSARFSPGGTKPREAVVRYGWGHAPDTGLYISDSLLAASHQERIGVKSNSGRRWHCLWAVCGHFFANTVKLYNVLSLSQPAISNLGRRANHEWPSDVFRNFIVWVKVFQFCPFQFYWDHYHITLVINQHSSFKASCAFFYCLWLAEIETSIIVYFGSYELIRWLLSNFTL